MGFGPQGLFWWTWTGSNRRPLPCHLRYINHLQPVSPKTKDLAHSDLDAGGRHEAPFGYLDSGRTPGLHYKYWHGGCPYARGCERFALLFAGEGNISFPYKDVAHTAVVGGPQVCDVDVPLAGMQIKSLSSASIWKGTQRIVTPSFLIGLPEPN